MIDPVSRINSDHPLVQFEQICALSAVVTNATRLPESRLRRLLASPSWIVSRSTWPLIHQLESGPLHQELVRRYRATADEKDKLLLLAAFSERPAPMETDLIREEALAASSDRVRRTALTVLGGQIASDQTLRWVTDHYQQFRPEDRAVLFSAGAKLDSEPSADLACLFLAHGFVPNNEFLELLNNRLEADTPPLYLGRVERAVQASSLAGRWQTLREKTKLARDKAAALQKEYTPLAEEFIQKAQALLTRYDVAEAKQRELYKAITDLSKIKPGQE